MIPNLWQGSHWQLIGGVPVVGGPEGGIPGGGSSVLRRVRRTIFPDRMRACGSQRAGALDVVEIGDGMGIGDQREVGAT